MKTAMQEVLNLVEQMFNNADALKLELPASLLNDIINIITQEGIPKEKEQIIQAYQVGGINNYDSIKFPNLTPEYFEICGEEYFVKHYNNEIL